MPNPDPEGWMRLGNLRPGAMFRTKDGIWAVKSRYLEDIPEEQNSCIQLLDGDIALFKDGNDTLAKEIVIRAPSTHTDPIVHPLDYDLLVFDVDGTLRRCISHKGPCHNAPSLHEIIPGTAEILLTYDWTRIGFSCASNQGGIGLGFITEEIVIEEFYKTIRALFPLYPWTQDRGSFTETRMRMPERGPVFRYAPHAPDAASVERKPSPWMLLELVRAYGERLDRTLFVGDSPEDQQAAERAGVNFVWAWQFFGRREDAPYLGPGERT